MSPLYPVARYLPREVLAQIYVSSSSKFIDAWVDKTQNTCPLKTHTYKLKNKKQKHYKFNNKPLQHTIFLHDGCGIKNYITTVT